MTPFDLVFNIMMLIHTIALIFYLTLYKLKGELSGKKEKCIKGELVVITGAGSGLGQKLAVECAKLKAIPLILDNDELGMCETEKMINNIGGCCMKYSCDITDFDAITNVADEISEEFPGKHVEILINNAGILLDNKNIEEKSEDNIKRLFNINTLSHFWTIKAFLPQMIENGSGHVVTVSSIAGIVPTPFVPEYVSSKFAAVGTHGAFTAEMFARNLHQTIKSTLICPFSVNTHLYKNPICTNIDKVAPKLSNPFVVNQILHGILTEETEVYIPSNLNIFVWLYKLLPTTVFLELGRICGSSNCAKENEHC